MGTRRYVVGKCLQAVATLFFVLTFNFFLFRVMPSDPVSLLARAEKLTAEDIAEQKAALGLDKPLVEQYVFYLRQTVTGELGLSLKSARPVMNSIAPRVLPTLLLVGLGTTLATVIGVMVGARGGWRRGSRFDTSTLYGSLVFYSMPEGWLGMILLLIFSGWLGWFPAGGFESGDETGIARLLDIARHLFLPLLTLTLGYVGSYSIVMRSSVLEVKEEGFVETARAKGVPDRLVLRDHAWPNAFLPSFTLIFLSFGYVLGGAIVVETIFSYPGIGLLTWEAINNLDYPMIQALFLLTSALVIGFNLAADLTYGYLDPRVRHA